MPLDFPFEGEGGGVWHDRRSDFFWSSVVIQYLTGPGVLSTAVADKDDDRQTELKSIVAPSLSLHRRHHHNNNGGHGGKYL